MRLIKMLGLAAVAAMAAMALVGATSASAANTQLCNSHTELVCGSAATTLSSDNDGPARYLSELLDLVCDKVDGTTTLLALASPQVEHFTSLEIESCETEGGDGCSVTMLNMPLATINKTGLDAGVITGTDGEAVVECEDVFLGVDTHCTFDATGLEFAIGAQHLTANQTQVNKVDGNLCPDETFLDALMKTESDRYVLA